MKKTAVIISLLISLNVQAQFYGREIAQTVMSAWKDSFSIDNKPAKWTYDLGVILKGIEGQWLNTGNGEYFKYIQKQIDFFVDNKGRINTYHAEDLNLDNIKLGCSLLMLYKVTLKEKYLIAANSLRDQLLRQPRTTEGGFWHKKIYPNQMWLDGLYMAQPFYAEYAALTHEDSAFKDIVHQFVSIENHTRNTQNGLLYHGWDESKTEKWADSLTGCSRHAWARAIGWYASALVDVLDWFPVNHPQRKALIDIVYRLSVTIAANQDASSGLWYDVLGYDGPGKEKNYLEASASCQFVYFMAKASRKGYINNQDFKVAVRGFAGINKSFVHQDNGQFYFSGTVKVSGLGNKPYRDGSFDYYMSEPVINNDPKGLGVYLIANAEMEMHPEYVKQQNDNVSKISRNNNTIKRELVLMDNYFNHETHVDAFGKNVAFHYKWWERDNGGFSFVAHILHKMGAGTATLDEAPTKKLLKNASVYILIDPDWPKENKTPNYIRKKDIKVITEFVRNGGVLLMMANDSNNVEFEHFNQLAANFGFQWNVNVRHDVKNDHFEDGTVDLKQASEIFGDAEKGYIKQLCTQQLLLPKVVNIKSVYNEKDEIMMTVARYGKGTVFAVGDPWFYNEYIDGRKLPAEYLNYKAAENLFTWLLAQSK